MPQACWVRRCGKIHILGLIRSLAIRRPTISSVKSNENSADTYHTSIQMIVTMVGVQCLNQSYSRSNRWFHSSELSNSLFLRRCVVSKTPIRENTFSSTLRKTSPFDHHSRDPIPLENSSIVRAVSSAGSGSAASRFH